MNLKLRIPDLFFSCRFTLFSFILIIEKPQKCMLTMVMIKQTSLLVSATLRCLRVGGVVGRRYKTCTITVNIVGNVNWVSPRYYIFLAVISNTCNIFWYLNSNQYRPGYIMLKCYWNIHFPLFYYVELLLPAFIILCTV